MSAIFTIRRNSSRVMGARRHGGARRAETRAGSGPSLARVAGPRLPRRLRQVKRKRGPEFPRYLAGARRGGAELPWSQPAAAANKRSAWVLQNTIIPVMSPTRAMQASITWASGARTAIPPIFISAGRPMAATWRCCARTACSRWPTIPNAVQAGARTGAGRGPAAHRGGGRRLPGDPFRTRRRALGRPHAGGAGLTSCPQRLWKSLGIAAVHV